MMTKKSDKIRKVLSALKEARQYLSKSQINEISHTVRELANEPNEPKNLQRFYNDAIGLMISYSVRPAEERTNEKILEQTFKNLNEQARNLILEFE